MDTKGYFDAEAGNYQRKFMRGWRRRLRQAEQKAILRLLQPTKGEQILDAGCGVGLNMLRIKETTMHVYGLDFSPRMAVQAKGMGLNVEQGSLNDFRIGVKFDKILCAGVLEFCQRHDEIMQNFYRHLKPKGQLVLAVPQKNLKGWLYWFYHMMHKNKVVLFSKKDLRRLHKAGGFLEPHIEAAGLEYVSKASKV